MLPLSTLKKTVGPFKATTIFRVMHVNSQSIMNKIDHIEVILDTYRPDIFCVSESWCNEHSINTTNISNYQIANYFIRRNHQHGGVTIYKKQDLVHSRISYIDNLSEEFVLEVCAIQLNSNEKSFGYVTKTKIDYFLSNVNNIHSENVLNLHLGDDLGLMLEFDFDTCIDKSTTRKITFRNTNTENFNNLCSSLCNEDFFAVFETKDVDACFSNFLDILKYHIDTT
nr:unnamed protein product [Callosobruchus analis]